eukprot:scaffold26700_cov147-Skeletonema_menzelii.AAC.2
MATTPKFSHRFSGISVWIEPDPVESSQLISEMEYLRKKCGGSEAGQYAFVPHCTLLYNTSFHKEDGGEQTNDGYDDGSCDEQLTKQQRQGESMLRQCLEEYQKQIAADTTFNNDGQQTQTNNGKQMIQLIPTSQYYFPYPKTADNGKGFGCCISLLILDTTPHLKLLHDIVRNRFPPDERHGEDGNDEGAEETKFRPHMALVYAPEDQENGTNRFLEKYTAQNDQEKRYENWIPKTQKDRAIDENDGKNGSLGWNAKYLSIWSTEGTLDEWYPIFKLDLEAAL